jgi:hypothetical protein
MGETSSKDLQACVLVVEDDPALQRMILAYFGVGADDYLTKPFNLRELLARVRAVLRRFEARRSAPARSGRGRWRFSGWQLDRRTRRLTDPDGAPVALTKAEYALLTAFLDAPQRPLSREHLLQRRAYTRTSSTEALMCGFCACGAARTGPERATHDPDRARRRIRVCRASGADLRSSRRQTGTFTSVARSLNNRQNQTIAGVGLRQ